MDHGDISERVEELIHRVGKLEEREIDLAAAILDYLHADMAAPWMPAAKRLEKVLMERLKF